MLRVRLNRDESGLVVAEEEVKKKEKRRQLENIFICQTGAFDLHAYQFHRTHACRSAPADTWQKYWPEVATRRGKQLGNTRQTLRGGQRKQIKLAGKNPNRDVGGRQWTDRWVDPWHTAGSVQRRRWLRKGRRAAGCWLGRTGPRPRSWRSTGRSRPADCRRWSSCGPVRRRH